jgi:hypothetical protein
VPGLAAVPHPAAGHVRGDEGLSIHDMAATPWMRGGGRRVDGKSEEAKGGCKRASGYGSHGDNSRNAASSAVELSVSAGGCHGRHLEQAPKAPA